MINDFSDLKRLLKICRDQGVTEISMPQISLKLGDMPVEQKFLDDDNKASFPDGELTPEQLMYYSTGGTPENDPYLKGGSN